MGGWYAWEELKGWSNFEKKIRALAEKYLSIHNWTVCIRIKPNEYDFLDDRIAELVQLRITIKLCPSSLITKTDVTELVYPSLIEGYLWLRNNPHYGLDYEPRLIVGRGKIKFERKDWKKLELWIKTVAEILASNGQIIPLLKLMEEQ